MRSNVEVILFALLVEGVFCDTDAVKSVSVMAGDPVILSTDVGKQPNDIMRWHFNGTLIALINGDPSRSCLYDGKGGIFKGILKEDYGTGSLNITSSRSEHAGPYEAELIRSDSSGTSRNLNRNRNCDSTKIIEQNSNHKDIIIKFNLAVSASDSGKNKNEALIEPQDKEMEITVPDSGLSSAAVAGICAVVVLLVTVVAAVVVMIYRLRIDKKKNKQVSKDETQNEKSLMI